MPRHTESRQAQEIHLSSATTYPDSFRAFSAIVLFRSASVDMMMAGRKDGDVRVGKEIGRERDGAAVAGLLARAVLLAGACLSAAVVWWEHCGLQACRRRPIQPPPPPSSATDRRPSGGPHRPAGSRQKRPVPHPQLYCRPGCCYDARRACHGPFWTRLVPATEMVSPHENRENNAPQRLRFLLASIRILRPREEPVQYRAFPRRRSTNMPAGNPRLPAI